MKSLCMIIEINVGKKIISVYAKTKKMFDGEQNIYTISIYHWQLFTNHSENGNFSVEDPGK